MIFSDLAKYWLSSDMKLLPLPAGGHADMSVLAPVKTSGFIFRERC